MTQRVYKQGLGVARAAGKLWGHSRNTRATPRKLNSRKQFCLAVHPACVPHTHTYMWSALGGARGAGCMSIVHPSACACRTPRDTAVSAAPKACWVCVRMLCKTGGLVGFGGTPSGCLCHLALVWQQQQCVAHCVFCCVRSHIYSHIQSDNTSGWWQQQLYVQALAVVARGRDPNHLAVKSGNASVAAGVHTHVQFHHLELAKLSGCTIYSCTEPCTALHRDITTPHARTHELCHCLCMRGRAWLVVRCDGATNLCT